MNNGKDSSDYVMYFGYEDERKMVALKNIKQSELEDLKRKGVTILSTKNHLEFFVVQLQQLYQLFNLACFEFCNICDFIVQRATGNSERFRAFSLRFSYTCQSSLHTYRICHFYPLLFM